MNFLTYFRAFSYAMIAVAMLALVLAGGLSTPLALLFLLGRRVRGPERRSSHLHRG